MAHIGLAIIEGDEPGREFSITTMAVIGRDPEVDLVITDSDVSFRHATLLPLEHEWEVNDLGSTNGTFVNGQRVTGPQQLRAGDRIQIGGTVLEVRTPAPPPAVSAPAAPPEMAAPVPPPEAPSNIPVGPPSLQTTRVKQIPSLPILVFLAGQMSGTALPAGHQIAVGREAGAADVILDRDTGVSRRHAAFSPAGSGLTVQDLGSTNGTFVNGERLTGTVALKDGDRIQIGDTVIEVRLAADKVVEPPAAPAAAPAAPAGAQRKAVHPNNIEVEGLVKQFGEHRAVDGIRLHVDPGEIYGFLGPNGAGKSTTVHMLTTLLPPTSGTATIAGFDVVRDSGRVRATIGVALQAAALDSHLNAWEHMSLQTALHGIPRNQRKKVAQQLLERVALTDAADRLVGGYSGGMKRRLDLALALVHAPRVLFLDEPTTGLDPQSRTALWEEVARLVKEEGMTVFLTTQYLEEADVMADRVGIIDHGEIVAEDTPAALKAEIGRPTVEVVPVNGSDFAAATEVLKRFGELTSATRGGIAARLRPGIDDLADVIRALDGASIRVMNVQLHAPTLDDVFLVKTGRSLEGAAETAAPEEEGVLEQLSAGAGLASAGVSQ